MVGFLRRKPGSDVSRVGKQDNKRCVRTPGPGRLCLCRICAWVRVSLIAKPLQHAHGYWTHVSGLKPHPILYLTPWTSHALFINTGFFLTSVLQDNGRTLGLRQNTTIKLTHRKFHNEWNISVIHLPFLNTQWHTHKFQHGGNEYSLHSYNLGRSLRCYYIKVNRRRMYKAQFLF